MELNRELIEKSLSGLSWERFVKVAQENNMLLDFSEKFSPQMLNTDSLEKLNKALFEFHVVKGELECP